jgi:hypothetical protein
VSQAILQATWRGAGRRARGSPDAKVRTTLPDGTVVAYPSHSGDVLWRDAVTHSAENVGTTEAHYYAVELKDAPH